MAGDEELASAQPGELLALNGRRGDTNELAAVVAIIIPYDAGIVSVPHVANWLAVNRSRLLGWGSGRVCRDNLVSNDHSRPRQRFYSIHNSLEMSSRFGLS